MDQYIIITGNPVDGFVHIGPYATADEANIDADDGTGDWWVATLYPPEPA